MRDLPKFAPPRFTHNPSKTVITQERQYRLITPLFGGGVSPAEIDPITVIRATEIRGHLRFWWRACRGGQARFEGKISKMREEEGRLWGKAYKKGDDTAKNLKYEDTVQISVEMLKTGKSVSPSKTNDKGKLVADEEVAPGYVSFPLLLTTNKLQIDVEFKLIITFPKDNAEEIKAALWAWETFGGIGARTRRGFGALQLLKINDDPNIDRPPSDPEQAKNWLRKKLQGFLKEEEFPREVPHLKRELVCHVTQGKSGPLQAWKEVVNGLSAFRQYPYGRDGRYGRSKWPEAEAIRQIILQGRNGIAHNCPRAVLGLPIIFHFIGPEKKKLDEVTLQGAKERKNRLPSPLILRPLVCKKDKAVGPTKAVGLTVLLEGPRMPPEGLQLVDKRGSVYPLKAEPRQDKPKNIPMPILNREPDALQAFLKFLGGNRS